MNDQKIILVSMATNKLKDTKIIEWLMYQISNLLNKMKL